MNTTNGNIRASGEGVERVVLDVLTQKGPGGQLTRQNLMDAFERLTAGGMKFHPHDLGALEALGHFSNRGMATKNPLWFLSQALGNSGQPLIDRLEQRIGEFVRGHNEFHRFMGGSGNHPMASTLAQNLINGMGQVMQIAGTTAQAATARVHAMLDPSFGGLSGPIADLVAKDPTAAMAQPGVAAALAPIATASVTAPAAAAASASFAGGDGDRLTGAFDTVAPPSAAPAAPSLAPADSPAPRQRRVEPKPYVNPATDPNAMMP
jgi:hypothetical protein